jgi:NAD(P)-dependent dehydrogenase (short-subunit alcohol dehydrogenase family)
MRNILITGANRGLGLGFVDHYLQNGERVWACYRQDAGELLRLDSLNCQPIHWDVTRPLPETELAKLPDKIDILINNAGIYGSKGSGQSLQAIKEPEMLDVFSINTVAPIRVVQTLLPRLKHGAATIANMSSKMGSVSDNNSGGNYAYRASKSALCIVSKSMAIDLQKYAIDVLCLHPGWVQTDMTGHTGLIDIDTSVAGLSSVIDRAEAFPPGAFVAYDGAIIPY